MFEVHVVETKDTENCEVTIITPSDKIVFLCSKRHVTRLISRELKKLGL